MEMHPNMLESLYFLLRFLRHPSRIAAIAPSSRQLAAALTEHLDLMPGDVVLELGPGTGAVTRAIAGAMGEVSGVRYLGIEKDPGMCRHLARRYPQLTFVCDDVVRLDEILRQRQLGQVKAVISGVPLILLNHQDQQRVLDSVRERLCDGGVFRTISYLHSFPRRGARRLRRLMRSRFGELGMRRPVWRNLPPALVLSAHRRAPDTSPAFALPSRHSADVMESSTANGNI
jgi:phospholipid N-methyltransferase